MAPLLFEVEDPVFSWPSFLTAVVLVVPLGLLYFLVRTLWRLVDYRRSPALASLARVGTPIDQAVGQIDADLGQGNPASAMRGVLLTPSWLIAKRLFKLELVPLRVCPAGFSSAV